MANIHVVMGTTGEYSDRTEWPVMAYHNKRSAQRHVVRASNKARELFVAAGRYGDVPDGANEHDPDMRVDYTGTTYYIWTVKIGDAK